MYQIQNTNKLYYYSVSYLWTIAVINQPHLFPANYSNPPRAFSFLEIVWELQGSHVTRMLSTDWTAA